MFRKARNYALVGFILYALGFVVSAFYAIIWNEAIRDLNIKAIRIGDVTGAEGDWVVVFKGEVVASDKDIKKVFKIAEKYPAKDTVVTRVPYPNASFFERAWT